MVQIIQENRRPSLGERLMAGLGQAASQASVGIPQMFGERQNRQLQAQKDAAERQQLSQLTGEDLSMIQNPDIMKLIVAEKLKGQTALGKKSEEENKLRTTAQQSFNTAADLLKKGNIGYGSKAKGFLFGGETAHDVGKFQSALGGIEAILVDMVNRGTLSNSRFKYITETLLPDPTDRPEKIRGKLEALADLLGLDQGALSGLGENKEPKKKRSLSEFMGTNG